MIDKKKRMRILQVQKESNWALLWDDFRQGRHVVRGFPVSVHLATDAACNLHCPMCWQRGPAGLIKPPLIQEEHLIKFARQTFPTAKNLELNISGEPLMSRLIDLELALAEEYGVKILLTTNGFFLNAKKSRFLTLMRNIGEITFSFDSPHKKTYLSLRVGSDFEKVVENMRLFQYHRNRLSGNPRPYFNISMVLMKRNFMELPAMVAFAKKVGADRLIVHAMTVFTPQMAHEALHYNEPALISAAVKAQTCARKVGIELAYPMLLRKALAQAACAGSCQNPAGEPQVSPCRSLWFRSYLNALAQIVTCCAPPHPVMGSLQENDFEEIWNNAVYQRMRQGFLKKPLSEICALCVKEGIYCSIV
ncbi:MAG TPA: radical SAM protein [Candidatus Omnitrophota bacterium]|nr:radical SAM protein [Candidatus Omnitrophota bacterium]HPT07470.1 radical SAM protein [Candidatus Omnitrophota bacterium]